MPTRVLRDGILTSERVNALSERAELFYRRLMSVVDDYGRFSANLTLLRASCYPLKLDSVKEDSIKKHLAEAEDAGLIVLYTVADKPYLQMVDFGQRVQSKSKFPEPQGEFGDSPCLTVENRGPPRKTAPVEGGVGVGVGVEDGGGRSRQRRRESTLADWLANVGDTEAIPPDDPVFAYARDIGLPPDFLLICWREFEARHADTGKRYKDWRAVFRKCVRANWYRLWWESPSGWQLTTTGVQAMKAAA